MNTKANKEQVSQHTNLYLAEYKFYPVKGQYNMNYWNQESTTCVYTGDHFLLNPGKAVYKKIEEQIDL